MGAWVWRKRPGATGWQVVDGDTGWIDATHLIEEPWVANTGTGMPRLRLTASEARFTGTVTNNDPAGTYPLMTIPAAWRAPYASAVMSATRASTYAAANAAMVSSGLVTINMTTPGPHLVAGSWPPPVAGWPASLTI